MARWTRDTVERMAPDARALAAARTLARPGPWSDTGSTPTLVWGKCQGSGSTPYQVSVDLTGPAVTCSCPSRKFPCKHGLALLLLWAEGGGTVADLSGAEVPEASRAWAERRADRAAGGGAGGGTGLAGGGAEKPAEPADPVAQARRLERRLGLMSAGAADFELWLGDLYRQGLAAARQQPYTFWDEAAARLTDAQLPGLAARVRALPGRLAGRADWADVALAETGRWFAAVRAWQRRSELTEDDLGNVRAFLGWPVATEEIRRREPVADRWLVEGVHRSLDGRLQLQRTWIRGDTTGERLVVLDFAAGGVELGLPQVVGSVIDGPVVTWPGSGVRRALFSELPAASGPARCRLGPAGSVADALADAAVRLAANPFLDQVPVAVRCVVVPEPAGSAPGRVVDSVGHHLPLAEGVDPWPIVARTGDHPVALLAELDDGRLRPLTIELADQLLPVGGWSEPS